MKSRERVINAIEHDKLDRLPVDGWMRPETSIALREHFGVDSDEEVMKILGFDIRMVQMDPPKSFEPAYVHPVQKLSKDYENLYATMFDEWGIGRKAGSTGEYWHYSYHPLQHVSLDEYELPNLGAEGRFDRAASLAKQYRSEYAVAGRTVMGIFEQSLALRGYRTFLRDLYTNPNYSNALLDRVLEWKMEHSMRLADLGVDIIEAGDDLGIQTGLMIPPRLIKEYLIPRYKRWFSALKRKDVYIFFHSDGKIEQIIPDLIETGIDILNPIQPECMNPAQLKELYGEELTFHGTISVQKTLPFGNIEDVRNEVLERISTVGYNGGLIIAPTHQVDKHVPLANILALYEAAGSMNSLS